MCSCPAVRHSRLSVELYFRPQPGSAFALLPARSARPHRRGRSLICPKPAVGGKRNGCFRVDTGVQRPFVRLGQRVSSAPTAAVHVVSQRSLRLPLIGELNAACLIESRRSGTAYWLSMSEYAQLSICAAARCCQAIDVHDQLPSSVGKCVRQGPIFRYLYVQEPTGNQPHLLRNATIA